MLLHDEERRIELSFKPARGRAALLTLLLVGFPLAAQAQATKSSAPAVGGREAYRERAGELRHRKVADRKYWLLTAAQSIAFAYEIEGMHHCHRVDPRCVEGNPILGQNRPRQYAVGIALRGVAPAVSLYFLKRADMRDDINLWEWCANHYSDSEDSATLCSRKHQRRPTGPWWVWGLVNPAISVGLGTPGWSAKGGP